VVDYLRVFHKGFDGVQNEQAITSVSRQAYVPIAEFQALEKHCEKLTAENQALRQENQALKAEVQALREEVRQLKEMFKLGQLAQFGKQSEVGEAICDAATTDDSGQSNEGVTVSAHTRKSPTSKRKNTNDDLLKLNLPRHQIFYDLLENELTCEHCGDDLKPMGHDESLQLALIPSLLYLCQHIRKKYKCTQCHTVKMPEKPMSPIPKSRASASLLTEIVINKFQRHLPLYRQSQMFRSLGVTLGDSTLSRWCMQVGEILLPLYEAMCNVIIKQHYLQVDETPITVLNPNRKGYLWCYYALLGESKGLIVYDFHLSRGKEVPGEFLKDYKGLIQVDGYEGYYELEQRKDITRIGCLTHVRRKFAKVLKISKNKTGIAAEVIERLKPLYSIEKYAKEHKLDHRTRKRLRQKQAWPILKALKRWLKKEKPKVPPKSQLGNAIEHFLSQWHRVTQYLQHGIAEIDTNIVENLIRPIAIGKKNYLFFHHEASGAINGALYSLVQSALLNKLEPRTYINYVLTKAHDMRQEKVNPHDLLPHIIDKNVLEEFAAKQREQARVVMNAMQPPPKT